MGKIWKFKIIVKKKNNPVPNATSEKVCNRLMGTRLKKKIKKLASIAKEKTVSKEIARIMI